MGKTVLEIQAKDNASQVINGVKQSIDGVKKSVEGAAQSSSDLDKIKQQFDKITSAAMPPKKEMRQLRELMARMNLNGLANTDVFTEVAQRAGELKDAMSDASDAMNRYASDTFTLQATAQAFQGVAAAGSIATGVVGLLGGENEKLQKILVKVQAAQAVLNGVMAIANILNKDSALMLKLKAIRMATSKDVTVADTVATQVNTVAQVANKTAVKSGTIAQTAWNVAKAIGKAMCGDFTGLLLLGIGAITTYALVTDTATDAEENRNKTLSEAQKLQKEKSETEQAMASAVANAAAQQLASYYKLQQKWNECNGDVEKQRKFMADYRTEINNTGFAVNDLKSAEDFFVNNTDAVVQAIMQRARAQAAYEVMVDKLKKSLEKLEEKSVRSGDYYTTPTPDNLTAEEKQWLRKNVPGSFNYTTRYHRSTGTSYDVESGVTDKGLEEIRKRRNQQAIGRKKQWQAEVKKNINGDLKFYADIVIDANSKLQDIQKQYGLKEYTPPKHTTGGHTNKPDKKTETPAAKNSIADMEKTVSELETSLKKGLIPDESIPKTIDTIKQLKDKIEAEKIRLGFVVAPKEGSIAAMQKELNKITSDLQNGLISEDKIEATKKKVEKLQKDIKSKKMELGLEPMIETGSIGDLQNQISEIEDQLKNKKLTFDARLKLVTKKEELQKQIDANSDLKDITIKANVEPVIVQKGTVEDKRLSLNNAKTIANRIKEDVDNGIIDTKKAKEQINELNEQLQSLGLKPIKIELTTNWSKFMDGANAAFSAAGALDNVVNSADRLTDALSGNGDAWTIFTSAISLVEGVLNAINTAMEISNMLSSISAANKVTEAGASVAAGTAATEQAAMEAATIAPKTAETVANKALEASVLDLAAAEIFAAHAAIPFVGPGIATGLVTGMMAAMAAQHAASLSLQAYADGGIVKGRYNIGDYNIIRANNGEMILNNRQQANLFKAIDQNRIGNDVVNSGQVEFLIKGDKLYGVLKNYEKIHKR